MRLPGVAIAAAFAGGIVLGLHPAIARNAASFLLLASSFIMIAIFILTGILLVRIGRLVPAAVASILSSELLGCAGVCIPEQPRDSDHVISVVDQRPRTVQRPL